jgi:hypothetical protein
MSDFLTNLLLRSRGALATLQPRPLARFEAVEPLAVPVLERSEQVVEAASPLVTAPQPTPPTPPYRPAPLAPPPAAPSPAIPMQQAGEPVPPLAPPALPAQALRPLPTAAAPLQAQPERNSTATHMPAATVEHFTERVIERETLVPMPLPTPPATVVPTERLIERLIAPAPLPPPPFERIVERIVERETAVRTPDPALGEERQPVSERLIERQIMLPATPLPRLDVVPAQSAPAGKPGPEPTRPTEVPAPTAPARPVTQRLEHTTNERLVVERVASPAPRPLAQALVVAPPMIERLQPAPPQQEPRSARRAVQPETPAPPISPLPSIQVSIGRIEVRAAIVPPTPKTARATTTLSLEEYLRQRKQGGRQ